MTSRTITCLALTITAVSAGTYIYLSEDRLREASMTHRGEESVVNREEATPVVPVGDFLYPTETTATTSSPGKLVEIVGDDSPDITNPPTTPPPLPQSRDEGSLDGQTGQCRRGGCSGQLCTDQPDVASTCEWREEYACYQTAVCERQISGECGWRETSQLQQCLLTQSQAAM